LILPLRSRHRAFGACLALGASLWGCAQGVASEPNAASVAVRPIWYRQAPAVAKRGVYIAEYYTNAILGYAWNTKNDPPPLCSIDGTFVVDLATDRAGDLIDPDGGSRTVKVFRGPAMCGSPLGSFFDSAGQPSDAATHDARHATIYVANIQAAGQSYGNISVCTLASGCDATLRNAAIGGQLFAVAEDLNGNLYASGYPSPSVSGPGSGSVLVYWKSGKGNGTVVTAYRNSTPGGLDVDRHGNLVALDTFGRALWVYTGCPDHCAGHGPFSLKGESVYGKINAKGDVLQAADFEYGQVDVYRYRATAGIEYLYSYNDGITPSGDVEGIAIDR
jgi:hypothetical protein